MIKLVKQSFFWAVSIVTAILTFVPDSIIGSLRLCDKLSDDKNLLVNRVMILVAVFLLSLLVNCLHNLLRLKIKVKGNNYTVQVEYGNLLKCKGCQKIIAFDECFTTKIGAAPHEIKPTSICGQYLKANPSLDVQKIIEKAGLKPEIEKSKYKNQDRYKSGSIAPNGDDLLMAFAKLDEDGRGYFSTREDYLASLTVMWAEIHKYYQKKDVCISVLGGGQTTIGELTPSNQELIDLIIESYKLHSQKIKNPQKLRIICRRKDNIMLNKVGDSI